MVLVIPESGQVSRPFTLCCPQRPCKVALYGISAKKALTMSSLQDAGNA